VVSWTDEGVGVAKGIMVVESGPSDSSRDADYNEWYRTVHVPEMCAVPGIVSAQRYRRRDAGGGASDPARHRYLTIYELEADDLAQPLDELARRSGDHRPPPSDARRSPPVVTVYERFE
jgi:hypothetical protein